MSRTARADQIPPKRFRPKRLPSAAALICVAVYACWWLFAERQFPRLPAGMYRGALQLNGQSGPFLVWVEKNGERMTFVTGLDQLQTGTVKLKPISESEVASVQLDSRLKLTGVFDNASGQAHGQMTSTNPAASGQWYLVREPTESLNGQSADATLDALMALQRAQDSLAAVEEEREALEGALEEVSAAAVDNPDFRSVAEQRLGVTQKNADELERKIQERQSSVDQLAEKLASSARVNAMGQLVSLGRESLRQDAQWIQSVLLRFAPETSGDFEKNLQRARSVDQMKRQIEDERRRLAELRSRANEIQRGDPDAAPEVESDE